MRRQYRLPYSQRLETKLICGTVTLTLISVLFLAPKLRGLFINKNICFTDFATTVHHLVHVLNLLPPWV